MNSLLRRVRDQLVGLLRIERRIDEVKINQGLIHSQLQAAKRSTVLADSEFKVFSQWGEDGIIQHLVRELGLGRDVFIEFGVQNYLESSTRFLLCNDNWAGLVIDGSEEHIHFIKSDPIYWRYNIKAECSFSTAENINGIISRNGISGEIGLLSVDIDGNDYWVWQAIDVVQPVITVVEYNARFGPDAAVTIPYEPAFVRSEVHHSMLYFGASLKALCVLGKKKGYAFVGCNSAGNNAFFVRQDRMTSGLRELTAAEGFVRNQFRESRDAAGHLTFESPETGQKVPDSLPLVNVE